MAAIHSMNVRHFFIGNFDRFAEHYPCLILELSGRQLRYLAAGASDCPVTELKPEAVAREQVQHVKGRAPLGTCRHYETPQLRSLAEV